MRGRKWLSAALLRMTAPSRFATALLEVGMACGHGAFPYCTRLQTAPGHCQAIPAASAVQYRRDTPKCGYSRAFDHIGRFSPSAVHRCAMLGMPGRGDVPATDDGMGERLMLNDDLDGQRGAWHHPQVRYDRHAIMAQAIRASPTGSVANLAMIRLCCMSVAMFAAMMNWALLRVPSASAGEEGLHRGDVMRRTTGGVSDDGFGGGSAGCHRGFRPT